MKKRLNLITVFFIGAVICAFVVNFYMKDTKHIFTVLVEEVDGIIEEKSDKIGYESLSLKLWPVNKLTPDSLFNEKTGEWIPARIESVSVSVPTEKVHLSILEIISRLVFLTLALAGIIMVFLNFVKIIIAVNKSVIFDWVNVKRIRMVGIGFLLVFVADTIFLIYSSNSAQSLVRFSDYSIVKENFNIHFLLSAMVAFIVAEIFAVGLRLKEEQDLTI